MKQIAFLLILFAACANAIAQESMEQVMEKRGKEMVRVIGLADKELWKKFIKENYTQALIDRKMKSNIQTQDGVAVAQDENKKTDNLEQKAAMYERLHNDLGKGKITSLKHNGEKLEIEVEGDEGANLKFSLTFLKEKPYLIDAMGVQMMMNK